MARRGRGAVRALFIIDSVVGIGSASARFCRNNLVSIITKSPAIVKLINNGRGEKAGRALKLLGAKLLYRSVRVSTQAVYIINARTHIPKSIGAHGMHHLGRGKERGGQENWHA